MPEEGCAATAAEGARDGGGGGVLLEGVPVYCVWAGGGGVGGEGGEVEGLVVVGFVWVVGFGLLLGVVLVGRLVGVAAARDENVLPRDKGPGLDLEARGEAAGLAGAGSG